MSAHTKLLDAPDQFPNYVLSTDDPPCCGGQGSARPTMRRRGDARALPAYRPKTHVFYQNHRAGIKRDCLRFEVDPLCRQSSVEVGKGVFYRFYMVQIIHVHGVVD